MGSGNSHVWGGCEVAKRGQKSSPPTKGPKSQPTLPASAGQNGGNATTDDTHSTQRYVQAELTRRLQSIGEHLQSDVLTCIHPIGPPFDDLIRDYVEDMNPKREKLLVVLETNGGSIETAERIADVFRRHYPKEVSFLIPNFAMSAGTVLVMSGDAIYMDYYSIMGPIDPQIRNREGTGYVPALGYLEKYNELVKKSKKGGLSQAELAFLIEKFDPADLHRFEQARDHSVDLLKKWLVKYKFKNWDRTRGRNLKVTVAMRESRAAEIARKLNDTRKWRSHGRGLSIDVVERDLNLMVENFGTDPTLNKRVRAYYRLLQDYLGGRQQSGVLHTHQRFMSF